MKPLMMKNNMEVQKKYRWALTGLIIMILINAATLISIWLYHPDGKDWRSHRNSGHDRGSIQEYMKDQLGLTDEQAEEITGLRRGHYREIRSFRDSLDQNRRAYFEFVMSPEADDQAKRDSLLSLLTEQYENIEGLLYNHMTEVKDILNDDQLDKFEEMMLNNFFKDRKESNRNSHKGQR